MSKQVVFSADELQEGDVIAYPGLERPGRGRKPYKPSENERSPRSWLKVSRIEGRMVFGERVNPDDWEVGVEFAVYPLQIEENGVYVAERVGV